SGGYGIRSRALLGYAIRCTWCPSPRQQRRPPVRKAGHVLRCAESWPGHLAGSSSGKFSSASWPLKNLSPGGGEHESTKTAAVRGDVAPGRAIGEAVGPFHPLSERRRTMDDNEYPGYLSGPQPCRRETERTTPKAPGPPPGEKTAAQQQVERELAERIERYKAGTR